MKFDFGDIMAIVGAGMRIAEIAKDKKGKDKKTIATDVINASIPAVTGLVTSDAAADAEMQDALSQLIDAQARMRNVLQKKAGQSVSY
jgi:hypothetical protein